MSSKINQENKCSHLFENFKEEDKLKDPLQEIFMMQLSLQQKLASTGRGVDYEKDDFMANVKDISIQWRNLSLEFAELLERLPFKEWKTYPPEKLTPEGYTEEETLETLYEYADMFHFFINIGLALGVNGHDLERLYVTKNKENFDRQKRGY